MRGKDKDITEKDGGTPLPTGVCGYAAACGPGCGQKCNPAYRVQTGYVESSAKFLMLRKAAYTHRVVTCSKSDPRADYYAQNIRTEDVVFFRSGQFKAALAKTVDHLFGTSFQNEQQFNEGRVVTQDGFRFRLRQDDIAEVIGYSGSGKELDIPETVQGHVVTRVAPFAFSRQRQITAVSIPDTVDSIGQEAFYICPSLQQLKLPARLKIIGKNAFNYCRALKSVIIPTGTIHIDRHAFYDCTALKTISIPDTVGFMGEKVFGADGEAKVECTIVCRQDSYVEHYAKENGILCAFV